MASGALRAYQRPLAAAVAAVCALALIAGCGEAKFQYVSNVDEQTYYKVPTGFTEVTEGVDDIVNAYLGLEPESELARQYRAVRWSKVFDASPSPDAGHVTSSRRTVYPVIHSLVQHVMPEVQGIISLDLMRDLIAPPVTKPRRDAAEKEYADAVQGGYPFPPPFTNFELLYDEVLTPVEGIHGVRTIYNYKLADGSVNTFDRTTLTNNDSTVLYVLLIRCDAECYHSRLAEFNDIATSFTVRSKP
jgi:hypothetical protein